MTVPLREARLTVGPAAVDKSASCLRAFEQELDHVCRALRRYGVAPGDVEDLAQDVFVVLCRRWEDYQQDRPLRPWLLGIAAHLAIKHLDRRRREVLSAEPDAQHDTTPLPDERLASERARTLALQAIASLPPRHRTTLVMHELDGVAVKDLAVLWSVPLFTVYTRVRAARRAFAGVVTDLQRLPSRSAAPMTAEELIALERQPKPMPEGQRLQLAGRLRALLLLPEGQWPRVDDSTVPGYGALELPAAGPSPLLAALVIGGFGLVLLGGLLAQRLLGREPTPPAALTAAVANNPSAPRPRRPVPPPMLRPMAALPAPDPAPPPAAEPAPPAEDPSAQQGGLWRFEEETAGVARDSSGRGHDCQFMEFSPRPPSWIDGARGRALRIEYRGKLTCAQPDGLVRPGDELTVALWIRPSILTGHRAFVARAREGDNGEYYYFGLSGGQLRLFSNSWRVQLVGALPLTTDGWTHVAFTQDREGRTRLYIEGNEVAQGRSRLRGPVRLVGPLSVGAGLSRGSRGLPGRPHQQWNGALDELLVEPRALTPEQLRELASRRR